MAKIPDIKRLRPEDTPDAPEFWIDASSILNIFMETVTSALNAQVDFDENIRSKIVENTFTTRSDYTPGGNFDAIFIKGLLTARAKGVMVLRLSKADAPNDIIKTQVFVSSWREDTNGNIKIQFIAGLENSTRYTVRFLVI